MRWRALYEWERGMGEVCFLEVGGDLRSLKDEVIVRMVVWIV